MDQLRAYLAATTHSVATDAIAASILLYYLF